MTQWRAILVYGALIAIAAFGLEWLDYRHSVRALPTPYFVVIVAILFAAVGIWMGVRLTARAPAHPFARNDRAIAALGISARECEVLELLAEGLSNKEIARRLDISPNTVKTHVARLFEKLEVARRTEAIRKARALAILR